MNSMIIALDGSAPTVVEATKDIFTLVGNTITTITGQPILLAYFAAGLIGVAISVIRKLKR